jgi:hypothetical protein
MERGRRGVIRSLASSLLVGALALLLGGCAATPAPDEPGREFSVGSERYRVNREYTSGGPGEWLLWREEGLTWRLVATKSASP